MPVPSLISPYNFPAGISYRLKNIAINVDPSGSITPPIQQYNFYKSRLMNGTEYVVWAIGGITGNNWVVLKGNTLPGVIAGPAFNNSFMNVPVNLTGAVSPIIAVRPTIDLEDAWLEVRGLGSTETLTITIQEAGNAIGITYIFLGATNANQRLHVGYYGPYVSPHLTLEINATSSSASSTAAVVVLHGKPNVSAILDDIIVGGLDSFGCSALALQAPMAILDLEKVITVPYG